MQTRTKWIVALAAVGTLAAAGTGVAQHYGRGGMGMGMMGGPVVEQLMREVDTNGDGRITQAEIDAAVDARFARFDANKDGRLSLDEFAALWADLTRPAMVRAFQFMDPDGDGSVTRAEVGQKASRLVQRFDRNGDGALSPEDRRGRGGPERGGPERPAPQQNRN